MSSQWPVSTQTHTMATERENETSSAAVNRPHVPNEIFLPLEHGLMRYWHMGSSRKARAMVAIIAVQMAKSICMESKKKNMTRSEMEAPRGRHSACIVSRVCTLFSVPWPLRSFCSCSMFSDLKLP